MSTRWAPWQAPTAVSAREFVLVSQRLLDVATDATAAASGVPAEQMRRLLIDGLTQSLSTDGPLSVVRIDTRARHGGARSALQESVQRANQYLLSLLDDPVESPRADVDEGFVSHCVGYVWTPAVAEMLTGVSGTHVSRNHYNEWLWQMVSLRDALIPFARPDEIRVVVDSEGLRRIEPARDRFVFELTSRRVSFATLFALVAAVLGGSGPVPAEAYGARTSAGLVLPSMIARRDVDASSWQFDVVDTSPSATTGYVVASDAERLTTPDEGFLAVAGAAGSVPGEAQLVAEGDTLLLASQVGERRIQVDVAAIVAGHRRALRPTFERSPSIQGSEAGEDLPVISTHGHWPLIATALGTIKPGHAVLWRGEDVSLLPPATEQSGTSVLVDLRPQP